MQHQKTKKDVAINLINCPFISIVVTVSTALCQYLLQLWK